MRGVQRMDSMSLTDVCRIPRRRRINATDPRSSRNGRSLHVFVADQCDFQMRRHPAHQGNLLRTASRPARLRGKAGTDNAVAGERCDSRPRSQFAVRLRRSLAGKRMLSGHGQRTSGDPKPARRLGDVEYSPARSGVAQGLHWERAGVSRFLHHAVEQLSTGRSG